MTTGIVIVTYNSEGAISRCLEAATKHCANIVVVDNNSTDNTTNIVRGFPSVRLIVNEENRGFAGAVNQGVHASDDDLILLLNPDAFLTRPLNELERAFNDAQVGAAAGKLTNKEGQSQVGFSIRRFPTVAPLVFETLGLNRLWPANPVNNRYRCLDLDLESPADVEQPAGAFLMLRRQVWEELGGLDERFHPLWFEEVDYLKRLSSRGYSIRYVPGAAAHHLGAHSIDKLPHGRRRVYWYANLLKYAFVHFSPAGCRVVCLSVAAGALLRMVPSAILQLSLEPVTTYGEVIRMAAAVLLGRRPNES